MRRSRPDTVKHPALRPARNASSRVLTTRERQIALLVADGLKNRSIADRLALSPATVATYIQRIQARLGLSGRQQIAAWVTVRANAEHKDILRSRSATELTP